MRKKWPQLSTVKQQDISSYFYNNRLRMESVKSDYQLVLDSLNKLAVKIKPDTSSMLKSAIVAIYSADDNEGLRYSQQIGLLHLDYDRHINNVLLRLFHLQTLELMFQYQPQFGFMDNYRLYTGGKQIQNLYTFTTENSGIMAFQFKCAEDANIFNNKLKEFAPTLQKLNQFRKKQKEQAKKNKQANSFFNRFKNIFKKQATTTVESKDSMKVLSVQKRQSLRINSKGELVNQNVPQDWVQIFNACKLTTHDLRNKSIINIIMEETLLFQKNKTAIKQPKIQQKNGKNHLQEHNNIKQPNQASPTIQEPFIKPILQSPTTISESSNSPIADSSCLQVVQQSMQNMHPNGIQYSNNNIIPAKCDNLMQQLASIKIRPQPQQTGESGIHLDASQYNNSEKLDLINIIKMRLAKRKRILNRQDDEFDSDN